MNTHRLDGESEKVSPAPVAPSMQTNCDKQTKGWRNTCSTIEAENPNIAETKGVLRSPNVLPSKGNTTPSSPLKLPSSAKDVHTYVSPSLISLVPQDITYQRARRSIDSPSTPGASARTYVSLSLSIRSRLCRHMIQSKNNNAMVGLSGMFTASISAKTD